MKLMFYGWGRYVKDQELINSDVSQLEVSQNKAYSGNEAYIERLDTEFNSEPDGLELVVKAAKVSLNGNYLVRVRLTKEEIANLARIAFAKEPFSEVIVALSEKPR